MIACVTWDSHGTVHLHPVWHALLEHINLLPEANPVRIVRRGSTATAWVQLFPQCARIAQLCPNPMLVLMMSAIVCVRLGAQAQTVGLVNIALQVLLKWVLDLNLALIVLNTAVVIVERGPDDGL